MKVYFSSDKDGLRLKDVLVKEVKNLGYEVEDLTEENFDFVDSSKAVCKKLLEVDGMLTSGSDDASVGILVDKYGAGSYMAATKHKGMIAAEVSEERSSLMTKRHNGARVLCLGSGIVGEELAKSCVRSFLSHGYDGGRHQIRIDMLNKMM
ncbi:galactose-6-phosphate isomerase subunit LacA [uncultured Anaerococcus sp.]|uniref:galactose-6-phosphate isomerase subunit LacA n=1 Tax=uncultured Anaerococcus sp. TaxID=293428 RepID=UPI0026094637|nr:galactose-6-phosphate isomerase subunit LacA [uncultured Anaerococcus sp.]